MLWITVQAAILMILGVEIEEPEYALSESVLTDKIDLKTGERE